MANGSDGTLKLTTAIDKTGAEKGAKDLSSTFDKLKTSLSNLSKSSNTAGISKSFLAAKQKAIELDIAIEDTKRRMQEIEQSAMNSGDATSKAYQSAALKVEQTRIAMGDLNTQMEQIATRKQADLSDFYGDPAALDKAVSDALEADKAYQKLGVRYDNLELKLKQQVAAQDAAKQAAIDSSGTQSAAYERLKNKLADLNIKQEQNATRMNASAGGTQKSASIMDRLAGAAKRAGSAIARIFTNTKKASKGTDGFSKKIQSLGNRIAKLAAAALVFNVIRRALRSLSDYLGRALQTNSQFVASLATIKGNLLTAFQPIFEAIMPALNALMAVLAKVTGYIAAFVSLLFGKSVKASQDSAKALYGQADALKAAGKAATNTTAAFDELDVRQEDTADTGAAAPAFDFDYSALDDISDKFGSIFDVFKDAWDNVGQYVIDGWKYALDEIVNLAKKIGATFLEVWTDGHGQAFLESLLTLLGTIGFIIGDIAHAFSEAWDIAGYDLVVSLFEMFTNIFDLLNSIGLAFREAWNDGVGVSIATNILQIFTNINNIIGGLAARLREAWEANGNGVAIWSSILGVVNSVLTTINKMTAATVDWVKNLNLTPLVSSFSALLKAIEPVVDIILDGLAWAYENVLLPLGKWLLELVAPAALDLIASVFDILYNVLLVLQPIAMGLWEGFLLPLGQWTGAIIIDTLTFLNEQLAIIGTWFSDNQAKFDALGESIGRLAAKFWELTKPLLDKAWETVKEVIAKIVEVVLKLTEKLIPLITSVVNFVTALSDVIMFSLEATGTLDLLSAAWDILKTIVMTVIDTVVDYIGGLMETLGHLLDFFTKVFTGDFEGALDSLWSAFESFGNATMGLFANIGNGIIEVFERAINWVVDMLNKIQFDIPDWVPGIGGRSFGINISPVSVPRIPIPALATGTVVPPGKPFLAELGDNTREHEVVSPLSTIEQAAGNAIDSRMGSLESKLDEVIDAINAITLNIDGQKMQSNQQRWANISGTNLVTGGGRA